MTDGFVLNISEHSDFLQTRVVISAGKYSCTHLGRWSIWNVHTSISQPSWCLIHYGQSVPMHQYLGIFIATHLAKPWPVAQKSRNGVSSLKTRLTMSHFPILFSCFENYKHSSFWSFFKINVPLFLSNGSRSVGQRQWINIETPVLVI